MSTGLTYGPKTGPELWTSAFNKSAKESGWAIRDRLLPRCKGQHIADMDKTTNHAELLTITKSWKAYPFQLFCTQ